MTSKTTSSDNLTMPMTEHELFQVRVDAADEMYRIEAADGAFWGDDARAGTWPPASWPDARGTAVTARDAGPAPRCCGADPADEQARTAAHT